VRPVLLALQGRPPSLRPAVRAMLSAPVKLRPGRLHLVPCRVWREGGRLLAKPLVGPGTGSFSALAAANGLAVVPAEATDRPPGGGPRAAAAELPEVEAGH
jgi:molybdopterin biosynthesis enzyme